MGQTEITVGMSAANMRLALNSNFDSLYSIRNTMHGAVYLPTHLTMDTVNVTTLRLGGTTVTANASELNILDDALITTTELNYLVGVSSNIQTQLNAKQNTLVSGTNIRTINGNSLLGSGNITIEGGGSSTITDLGGTAWRVFYSNGSGEVTELALGADGTYLRSNGASAAPTFSTPSGTGDMLQSVYDTDENNVVDEAETAATVTGLSLGAGNLALVGDFSLTHTLFGNTGIRWPSSTNDSVAYRSWVRDYFDALLSGAETGISLADSVGIGEGTYATGYDLSLKANIASPTFTGTVSGITATMVGLGNVTNESKTTMFTNPLFTGVARLTESDTLATRAYARTYGGTGTVTEGDVSQIVHDSLTAFISNGVAGISVADSGVYDGGYVTPTGLDAAIAAVETGAVDSSLYVTVTRLTDSLNVIRSQISSLISTINSAGLLVTSINVASLSKAVIIDTDGGSLDFEADVSPNTALDTTVTWSYIAGTGTADFETEMGAPTLTALTNGTVTVRATANDGSGIYGEVQITISNQVGPIAMSTAELGTYNDSIILTIWDRNLHQDSIPPTSAFALTEDGNTFGIEAITINYDSLFIALDSTGAYGSTYLLSYTPGTPAVQDSSGNNAASFTGQAVTNNISSPAINMIANGTFDNTDYWTLGTNLSISGGTLNSSGAFNQGAVQSPSDMINEMQPGVNYTVSFDVSGVSGSDLRILISCDQNANFWTEWDEYTNGSYSIDFTTTDPILYGGTGIQIRFQGGVGSIDNFRIVER